jgi:acyl carrier protein
MADRNAIKQTLVQLIEEDTGIRHENLDEGKNLRTELGLDSVDLVSVVSQVERQFRIRLSQEELQKIVTVGDVLDLMQAKLEALPTPKAA